MKSIAVWGLIAIACCLLAWPLAAWKNRNASVWAAWSFLIPPAILLLLILPKRKGHRPRQPSLDELDRIEDRTGIT
jgi:hypothetical protein